MLIHTEEKPYGKLIHTGKEPYIYDYIIVSLIKNQFTRITPCQTYWLKLNILVTENSWPIGFANLMLKSSLFILFCKTDADFHQIATFMI